MNFVDGLFILSQFFYVITCCVVFLMGIYTANDEERKFYKGSMACSLFNFGVVWSFYWYLTNHNSILLLLSVLGIIVSIFSMVMFRVFAPTLTPKYAYVVIAVLLPLSMALVTNHQKDYLNLLGDVTTIGLVATPFIDEIQSYITVGSFSTVPISLKLSLLGYALLWEAYKLLLPHNTLFTIMSTLASSIAFIQVGALIIDLWYHSDGAIQLSCMTLFQPCCEGIGEWCEEHHITSVFTRRNASDTNLTQNTYQPSPAVNRPISSMGMKHPVEANERTPLTVTFGATTTTYYV